MQHLRLNNILIAQEHLNTAWEMCQVDPLLCNEMGVNAFYREKWVARIRLLVLANVERDATVMQKRSNTSKLG